MRTTSATTITIAKRRTQPIDHGCSLDAPFNDELAALDSLSPKELRSAWQVDYGFPAPALSSALLRSGIAWQRQVKRNGGHSKSTMRLLTSGRSSAAAPKLCVGTRLVRDWHGKGHSVTVTDDGFEYEGHTWRSLTAIARHITGAKWSGPRFFGVAS